ncbi:alkyl hydroperoxide reductase/ thiol specific antioxidant/ mal allergen [Candidatus Omnitrophus magneticus]|uniref:Alkyl hydroperoxide reductase/ thiol specific antioxidant/ mal allergen n=1 Tax=Candidatus Omnitrophus magneticus TaxID=1609969 RepID=A0A0F0CP28_9BACT|nr:alkyl hydroperoxide reductase/ thiol specific antioxidant/ mal allergen [Candidatus Omnitrophus magneticus]
MKKNNTKIMLGIIVTLLFLSGACSNVDGASPVNNGEAKINFELENISGGKINLKDTLVDKDVILIFWATWCPYCVKEIPDAKNFYSKNSDDIEVIGVNIQEAKNKVAAFAEKNGINYPIVLDKTGEIAQSYKVRGIPSIIAISKEGNIVYTGQNIFDAGEKLNAKK